MPLGLLMCLLCSLVFQPFRHLLKSKYSSVRCLTCISEITCIVTIFLYLFKIFKIFYLFIFREGKGGRKRGGETSMCGCLSCAPLGTWLTAQACALIGNQTHDPLVHRPALNPLSHTSQGYFSKY